MIPLPSAILFTCLAPLTALGNGFLILIFYKNSSTLLRTPSNFFIFSMAWANFLTGFVLQPLLAYRYYSLYLNNELLLAFRKVMSAFSIVTMNASIFSVCAFSWDSFLALTQPVKHRRWVTVQRAKVAIGCVWIYQIGFASLLFTNIPLPLVLRIDLHVNTTLISALLLLCYVCLYKAFKQRERKRVRSFNSPRPPLSFRVSQEQQSGEANAHDYFLIHTGNYHSDFTSNCGVVCHVVLPGVSAEPEAITGRKSAESACFRQVCSWSFCVCMAAGKISEGAQENDTLHSLMKALRNKLTSRSLTKHFLKKKQNGCVVPKSVHFIRCLIISRNIKFSSPRKTHINWQG